MEKTYKFTLPQNKEVNGTKVRIENGEVIVDVEFKERFEPKDGDILIAKHSMSTSFFIYKHTLENGIVGCYYAIQKFHDGDVQWTNGSNRYAHKENCRFATPEEKTDFLARLEKERGIRWNAETKQLEDIRWKPNNGDAFYYVDVNGDVRSVTCTCFMNFFEEFPNCFKTPEAAQKVADQIKEIFKNSKAE